MANFSTYGFGMGQRRANGTGSIFRDYRGYWTVAVPLEPEGGKRRRKVKRFPKRADAIAFLHEFERSRSGTDLPDASEYPVGGGRYNRR